MKLTYEKWIEHNYDSVKDLYYDLIELNTTIFNTKNCTLNKFCLFCYTYSSKEKYIYL